MLYTKRKYNKKKIAKKTNKTKDWALVQNAALAGGVKVELGFLDNVTKLNLTTLP